MPEEITERKGKTKNRVYFKVPQPQTNAKQRNSFETRQTINNL